MDIMALDITDPSSSPSGVNFMPSSGPAPSWNSDVDDNDDGRLPISPWWPKNIESRFDDYIRSNGNRSLLTPSRRAIYRYFLNNRTAISQSDDPIQRRKDAVHKYTAIKFYELQDNQIYRKREQRKDGS